MGMLGIWPLMVALLNKLVAFAFSLAISYYEDIWYKLVVCWLFIKDKVGKPKTSKKATQSSFSV